MQLTTILLIAVATLAMLSGWAVFIGARKKEKLKAAWFLAATIGACLWTFAIAAILSLKPEHEGIAPVVILGIYLSPLLMDAGLIGFILWDKKTVGKIVTGFFVIFNIIFGIFIALNQSLIYSSYTISERGNHVAIINDWPYYLFGGVIAVETTVMMVAFLYQTVQAKSKNIRYGNLFIFITLCIAGGLSLVFDIVLPVLGNYKDIWPGPLGMGVMVIAIYYAILRYRLMHLSSSWLKILSYIILIASASIIYTVIFFIIFTALFKIPNPSPSIFILNFIMIVIVLLLLPIMNEVTAFINSLISVKQIDTAYIMKKLNRIATNVDLNELADFLADHLHFSYVGFLIDGQLYGSGPLALSSGEIREISRLKKPEKGIWQEFNEPVAEAFKRLDINAVAELQNAKGKPFGQIIVGKPQGKATFARRDLIQLEMIINLVSAIIDTKA
ncbi:hypothetical protein IJI55_00115 [Candidatus Saccharibacteria bacterium]|nr:hypothetical protein [Candidatus Saccharibacteria bacterium]